MKKNVDLTEGGHFSEGWLQGGWRANGVFRNRKPMKTSEQFKKILKMGKEEKEYNISSMVTRLFGLVAPMILNSVSFGNDITIQTNNWSTSTNATTVTSNWNIAPVTFV